MTRQARLLATTLATTLASAALAVGLTTSPAQAREAKEVHPEWGSTQASNGVLRHGCKNYGYSYSISPPKGDWGLETFIVGPKGKRLASDAFVVGLDELSASATYRLCKPSTRPGTFKIKAKLTVLDGDDYTEGWLPVTRFHLRAPR